MTVAPLIGISTGSNATTHRSSMLRLRSTYPHAVSAGGAIPIVIPSTTEKDVLRSIYDRLDGILISGGGDIDPRCYGATEVSPFTMEVDSARDEIEIQLARWAAEDDKPLLAICRGHQVLNVALGGTLFQDIRDEVPNALRHESPSEMWFDRMMHEVSVVQNTILWTVLRLESEQLQVNSLHHQAIKNLGSGLTVTAYADDGIIEGIAMLGKRFIVGVQWHPEALVDVHPVMKKLFVAFAEASRR